MNVLIEMYPKYRKIHKEQELFDKIHLAYIVPHTTIIGGDIIIAYNKDVLKTHLYDEALDN